MYVSQRHIVQRSRLPVPSRDDLPGWLQVLQELLLSGLLLFYWVLDSDRMRCVRVRLGTLFRLRVSQYWQLFSAVRLS